MSPQKPAPPRPAEPHTAAPHFTAQSLKFLRGLKRNNDREWFEPRRPIFEQHLKAPMLSVIEAVNEAMQGFAPDNIQPPQKCMMRIYRDIRFSANKAPYKSQVAAWWARQGLQKTSGAGFYFSLSATALTIAAGVYMPERDQLLSIRRFLAEPAANHHTELRTLLNSRKLKAALPDFEGLPLTRAPKGFSPDDPALDLLLCRQWGVSVTLPAEVATAPTLVDEITTRFRLAAPIVALLNRPLAGKPKPAFF